jgi:hypothetical protein
MIATGYTCELENPWYTPIADLQGECDRRTSIVSRLQNSRNERQATDCNRTDFLPKMVIYHLATILTGGLDLVCYLMAPMPLKVTHKPVPLPLNHDALRIIPSVAAQGRGNGSRVHTGH